jgi:15-cis-phytoene synthase
MSAAVEIDYAYQRCEALTRAQAANFFYGIRLLTRERRRAMCAVYAFARRIDDIGDGTLAEEEKLRLLDREQRALALGAHEHGGEAGTVGGAGRVGGGRVGGAGRVGAGRVGGAGRIGEHSGVAGADPVLIALADAQRWFPLGADVLEELIEGVRMDVLGTAYPDFDSLVIYCRRVAGAIGRACLAIFGVRDHARGDGARAERLADELGVALQLINILRDLREDAQNGRVYLPGADLLRFGIVPTEGSPCGHAPTSARAHLRERDEMSARAAALLAVLDDERRSAPLAELVHFEAQRAREWFERGIALTAMLDRRSAACVLAMAGIYRRLLDRIDAHPEQAAERRMSLPAREKAWVAARGLWGVGA